MNGEMCVVKYGEGDLLHVSLGDGDGVNDVGVPG